MDEICVNLAKQKEEFLNAAEKYFEPHIKSAKEQGTFDWKQLRVFYNARKNELNKMYCLRMFCEYAFKLFVTFNCPEDNFVLKIVNIYQKVIAECAELDICTYCNLNHFPKHVRGEEIICTQLILKNVNKLAVDFYKFTNRAYYAGLANEIIIAGDFSFLQFLVKYGLSYNIDYGYALNRTINHCRNLFKNHITLRPLAFLEGAHKLEQELGGDSILKRFILHCKNLNMRRIWLTVMAVDLSFCKSVGDFYYVDYAKCLSLYALTLPYAEISMKDVKDVLHLLFPIDEEFRNQACSRFKEVFPDTPNLPSPRLLKYLCRCKVRACIQKCPSMVTVVSEMSIPTPMKEYLLFMSR